MIGRSREFRAGILMLDTRFPRIPGDVGNPVTWPFPVELETVGGIGVELAVREGDPLRFEQPFVDAAHRLEERGVSLITTSCGFLILLQDRLQSAVRMPVLTSSLLQVPWISAFLEPHAKIAILTFERSSLSPAHLWAAGINPSRVVIAGLEGTPFHATIALDLDVLDEDRARQDHVDVARRLVAQHPEIEAIVLECTNMPPYAAAIREATGLPVYDATTLINWAAAAFMHD
ncbi:MAG TPA: aspartate/glutamate racemase family protein [Candidatus Baltobacteraceae bacterium]|jgi:Asp/Glu/hydantoin racemase